MDLGLAVRVRPAVVMSIRAADVDPALVTVVPHDPRAGSRSKQLFQCPICCCAIRSPAPAYSFDIANGRIRAIDVVHNPDKLCGFVEHSR